MVRSIRNCQVAVTGAAGFLGSHLTDHLVNDRNCEVLAIDNLEAGLRKNVHPKAIFEHCDITGTETHLYKLFKEHRIQFVFQYAAAPYVPYSYERPLRVFDINAHGALKVINAAQEAGCQAVLQISSAEIYGGWAYRAEDISSCGKLDESAPVEPHSTYGAAKAAIDAMVQVRWKEAGTPVMALRQFNCMGERDFIHPYIVPTVIRQIHENTSGCGPSGGPIVRLGNNSVRDFLYSGDAVKMAVELLEKGEFGNVYNLGSENCIRIYELAHIIGRLMGWQERPICIVPDPSRVRPWEIWKLQSCNDKIYSVIERRPEVGLEEMLQRTIDSIRDNNWRLEW